MMTKRDPWVNLLRTTVACFAAATGGADVITVEPFDSAVGIPDEFGRRLARNTQSILDDESSLARVSDPAAGSWYVESRTSQLAEAAWQQFTGIERLGGAIVALESGHLQGLLGGARGRRNEAIAHRRDPITGVSEFAFLDEAPLVRVPYPAVTATPLLWPHRYAETFENLRDYADARPVRPKVFLAALGPASAYTGRVDFTRNLFSVGGIESVVGSGELAEIVAAFTASGSALACLCSSDSVYAEQAAAATAALLAAGATEVWTAGQDLYLGCNAVGVLARALDILAAGR
jgi:methylmalonyl-CoA mutase